MLQALGDFLNFGILEVRPPWLFGHYIDTILLGLGFHYSKDEEMVLNFVLLSFQIPCG